MVVHRAAAGQHFHHCILRRELYEVRKLTIEDIDKLKLERVTEKDLEKYNEVDKEACYIYNLITVYGIIR